jgi:hypothetical protein
MLQYLQSMTAEQKQSIIMSLVEEGRVMVVKHFKTKLGQADNNNNNSTGNNIAELTPCLYHPESD